MKRTYFYGVSSRRSCRSSQNHLFNFTFDISIWGIDLGYCDVEWFDLEMNKIFLLFLRLHPSTAFQTSVDSEGYSIPSKRFLPTVVDIIVI